MSESGLPLPREVSDDEWRRELRELRAEEKAVTRRLDALAARRRRLPMTPVDPGYRFLGEAGERTLCELFDDRRQLIVYHFMFGADDDVGCPGCSWVTDAMSHPAHLHARDVSFVLVSRAPLDKLLAYRDRMGWTFPWYSSAGTTFNDDMGATVDGHENHGVSVFLRDGDSVWRTYFTEDRGVEHLGSHWTYLDLTPYGRQETWEESPPGWPQDPTYTTTRRHDEY
jgi:predicted dithiol-disulfide oxidoreductase (DUF899 family)